VPVRTAKTRLVTKNLVFAVSCTTQGTENEARGHKPRFLHQNVNQVTNAQSRSEIHKEVELNSENKNLEMTYNTA